MSVLSFALQRDGRDTEFRANFPDADLPKVSGGGAVQIKPAATLAASAY
jgi:hypothetical protein